MSCHFFLVFMAAINKNFFCKVVCVTVCHYQKRFAESIKLMLCSFLCTTVNARFMWIFCTFKKIEKKLGYVWICFYKYAKFEKKNLRFLSHSEKYVFTLENFSVVADFCLMCLCDECYMLVNCLLYVVFIVVLGYVSLVPYLGSILTYHKPINQNDVSKTWRGTRGLCLVMPGFYRIQLRRTNGISRVESPIETLVPSCLGEVMS
jgi:hypothetical protein